MDSGVCIHVALTTSCLLYAIRPPTAASCCFSSAISGPDVFLLYYCCRCVVSLSVSLAPLSITSSLFFSLRLLGDRLLLALAMFLFCTFLSPFFCHLSFRFSLLLFLCSFFLTSPPPPPPPSPLFLSHLLAVSLCFSLWQFCPLATYTPSFAHDLLLLSPLSPASLSPAPGCQTLPSRPRGKAKAVDFSPHQAF